MPATRSSRRSKKTTTEAVPKTPDVVLELERREQGVMAEEGESADNMTGIEEGSNPEEMNESENSGRNKSEGATTNGYDAPKLTMEERKAKLAQLRKKIVCPLSTFHSPPRLYFLHPYHNTRPHCDPFNRPLLQKQTAPLSLKRAPKPSSPYEMLQD